MYALSGADGSVQRVPNDELKTLSAEECSLYYWNWTEEAEISSATLVWAFETGRQVLSSPAVVDGVVYVGSFDQKVYALSATDGTKRWEFATKGRVRSDPAVVNGLVFVGSFDNYVYALRAEDGRKIWSFETGGQVRSSPAVVD